MFGMQLSLIDNTDRFERLKESELQSLTKSVKNFTLCYARGTHPVNLASWWPLPPPLPDQCC